MAGVNRGNFDRRQNRNRRDDRRQQLQQLPEPQPRARCPFCQGEEYFDYDDVQGFLNHLLRRHLSITAPESLSQAASSLLRQYAQAYLLCEMTTDWTAFAPICGICTLHAPAHRYRADNPELREAFRLYDRAHLLAHYGQFTHFCATCELGFVDLSNQDLHYVRGENGGAIDGQGHQDNMHEAVTIQAFLHNDATGWQAWNTLAQLIEQLRVSNQVRNNAEGNVQEPAVAGDEQIHRAFIGHSNRWTHLYPFRQNLQAVFRVAGNSQVLVRAICASSTSDLEYCCQALRGLVYQLITGSGSSNATSVLLVFGTDAFWTEFIELFRLPAHRSTFLNVSEPAHSIRTILRHPGLSQERFTALADVILINGRIDNILRDSFFRSAIFGGLVARHGTGSVCVAGYYNDDQMFVRDVLTAHTSIPIRVLLIMASRNLGRAAEYDHLFARAARTLTGYYTDRNGNWVAQIVILLSPQESRPFIEQCLRADFVLPRSSNGYAGQISSAFFCHTIQCALLVADINVVHNFAHELLYQPDRLQVLANHNIGNNILRRVFERIRDHRLCNDLFMQTNRAISRSGRQIPQHLQQLREIGSMCLARLGGRRGSR